MHRESSDQMASIASRMMRQGNPLDSDAVVDDIISNVLEAAGTFNRDRARTAVRDPLRMYFDNAKSLAASVVSQADGPE